MNRSDVVCATLVVAALVACKGKDATTKAQGAGSAAVVVDPATPAATVATLPAGDPVLGCFAWSPKLGAAACLVGYQRFNEGDVTLEYVGAPPTPEIRLVAPVAEATIAAANRTLAEQAFAPLVGQATPLVDGTPHDLGAGLTITWVRKEVSKGGDNEPPTGENTVTARCGGADVELVRLQTEGDSPTVAVRRLDDHVLVEVRIGVAREGEVGDDFDAIVLHTRTCKVATSAK
ncbi:MAG: hypothetical protein M3680_21395 [Myxococcota bacterium]|nr:hypothetical protein [Myxococcota bacterium]